MEAAVALTVIFTTALMVPPTIVGIVLRHRERMASLRNRQEGAPGLIEQVGALRREIATLRDTTTRFDMSFDAALHRVEQRLEGLEQAETVAPPLFVPTSTGSNYHTTAESETIEQAVVRLR